MVRLSEDQVLVYKQREKKIGSSYNYWEYSAEYLINRALISSDSIKGLANTLSKEKEFIKKFVLFDGLDSKMINDNLICIWKRGPFYIQRVNLNLKEFTRFHYFLHKYTKEEFWNEEWKKQERYLRGEWKE